MRRFTLAITAAAVVAFIAITAAAQQQQEQEKPRGYQAFCLWTEPDWFGPCRNRSAHANMDRRRHNEEVHGGEGRAEVTYGECEPTTSR